MDTYFKYINDGMNYSNETWTKFREALGREEVFKKNIHIKDPENMYFEDEDGYIRVHVKTFPLFALLDKSENTHVIITAVGKNNDDDLNKLNEEKSKYIYLRSYHELDEFMKITMNDANASFGKEEYLSRDYYKILKFKDGEKFLGAIINNDLINNFIADCLDYVLGKIKERASFLLKMEGFLKYFIIYDYEIFNKETYKMINNKLTKIN